MKTSTLVKNQTRQYRAQWKEGNDSLMMVATVRYDDQCGNGHNSFAITADIRMNGREYIGGCCHDEIITHIPSLRPYIKWHLCASDGPMHYIANTVYHAGDKDCNGLRAGEFRQHASRGKYQAEGVEGVPCWELKFPEGTKDEIYSHTKPAPVVAEWQPYGRTGEGKARELDVARSCAIWPEATDEELTAPGLEQRLSARLPALLAELQAAVESLGFAY